MKAPNSTTGSYQRQKGDGLPRLGLPWYRAAKEISENGRYPALKTTAAIFRSIEEWMKSNTQSWWTCPTELDHVDVFVIRWPDQKKWCDPLCRWKRKSLKAKRHIFCQKILIRRVWMAYLVKCLLLVQVMIWVLGLNPAQRLGGRAHSARSRLLPLPFPPCARVHALSK